MPDPLVVLGWREWVVLPALGVPRLRAKIDSGARSSSLHVDAHWRFVDGGVPWVGFRLSHGKARGLSIETQAPIHDEREVVDSGGRRERRIFLRTPLLLAGCEREIEMNLTNRGAMLFPMLLGRTAMTGLFTIDPASSFRHGRPPRPTSPTGAA